MDAPKVLIAGGGVAGLECLLTLRELAGDDVAVTMVAPELTFHDHPMTVAEPFGFGEATRHRIDEIARDLHALLRSDRVVAVDAGASKVRCASGGELGFDALVLALGAHAEPAFSHAVTFGRQEEGLRRVLEELEQGVVRELAFVVHDEAGWTLPLYELALMTAREAWLRGIEEAHISLITPEPRPLALFGARASTAVERLLDRKRIDFRGSVRAVVDFGSLTMHPGGESLRVDRVVTLPALTGVPLDGVPADDGGFIPVDPHQRVHRPARRLRRWGRDGVPREAGRSGGPAG